MKTIVLRMRSVFEFTLLHGSCHRAYWKAKGYKIIKASKTSFLYQTEIQMVLLSWKNKLFWNVQPF